MARSKWTLEEEQALVRATQAGDRVAERKLFDLFDLGIRRYAAKYARGTGTDFDEMYSAALEGFLVGVRKFNAERGVRVITYVCHWMRAHMGLQLRVSRSLVKRATRLPPGPLDGRLDAPMNDDSDETWGDRVVDERPDPETKLAADEERRERLELAAQLMLELDPRQRGVVEERLMQEDEDTSTLEEIGDRLGISRERVRQIEAKALRKMRKRHDHRAA